LLKKYSYILSDAVAEYDWLPSQKYKITPGISYQGINFDDTKYHDNVTTIGLFNGKPSIHNVSGYLRSDLNFTQKLECWQLYELINFQPPIKFISITSLQVLTI